MGGAEKYIESEKRKEEKGRRWSYRRVGEHRDLWGILSEKVKIETKKLLTDADTEDGGVRGIEKNGQADRSDITRK